MKKYLSLLIIFILTFGSISVMARTEVSVDCTSLSDWTAETSGSADVTAVENGGGIRLSLDTQNASASAEIKKAIPFDGNKLVISTTFSVDIDNMTASKNDMIANASDGTENKNILYYRGGVLYVFTNNADYKLADSLATGTEYTVDIAIDTTTKDCAVWFKAGDNAKELKFSGSISALWTLADYENLVLSYSNKTTGRSGLTTTSDFIIRNVTVNDAATGAVYSPDTTGGILTHDNVDKISVDFGGKAAPVMYNKSNYVLKKDGEPIEFALTEKLSGIEIVPTGGFAGGTYLLSAIEKKGIFNEALTVEDFTLTLASAGYVIPVIELSASKSEGYVGNTIDITASVTSETAVEKVVYTVDGETVERTDSSDNYKLSLQKEAGNYEVKAYAVDSLSGRSLEKSVTVTFKNNTAPTVAITNITDGASIKANEFPEKIIASASDAEALTKVEIYIDGSLKEALTEAPFEYAVSGMSNGNHSVKAVAYDDGGLTAEDEVSFMILPGDKEPYVIWENDFNTYAGGDASSGSDFFWYAFDLGEITADTSRLDTEGKALHIKYDNTSQANTQPFIRTDTTSTACNKLRIEYDLKIEDLSEVTYYLKAGATDSPHSRGKNIVAFSGTELVYYNNGSETSDTYTYPKNQWMSVFCEIDFITKNYTFILSDESGNVLSQATKAIDSTWEWVKVCSYFPSAAGKGFEITFDNFRFSSIDSVPVISKVGQNGNENEAVTPAAQDITVKLTAALKADSVTADNVSLLIGEEEILIKEVSYASMKITIVPDEQLRSQEEYTVLIKETTQMPTGEIIGEAVTGKFTTLAGELDLISSSVVTGSSGTAVTGEFVCTESESKTIYIILSVWDGDKLIDTAVKEFNVSSSNKTFTTDSVSRTAGQTMELYIWDSLVTPSSVATKIYRY